MIGLRNRHDLPILVMMSEMVPVPSNLIEAYGAQFPGEYGGAYLRAGRWVVLFTDRLSAHQAALRELVSAPDDVVVRPAQRTWEDLKRIQQEVGQKLMIDEQYPGVSVVGIGTSGEQFAVLVGVHPCTEEVVADIARRVEPHSVVVREQRPGRYV